MKYKYVSQNIESISWFLHIDIARFWITFKQTVILPYLDLHTKELCCEIEHTTCTQKKMFDEKRKK